MTLRRFLLMASLGIGAAIVGGVPALLFVELSWKPAYDQSDPDYQRYSEEFDRLRAQIDSRGTTNDDAIDLSRLNNGEWKTACLLGGYSNPLRTMQELGAKIGEKDRMRLTEAGSRAFRLAQVEEYEMAIGYVDLGNNARFIHFRSGIGPEGKRFQRCISGPQTRIFVAP